MVARNDSKNPQGPMNPLDRAWLCVSSFGLSGNLLIAHLCTRVYGTPGIGQGCWYKAWSRMGIEQLMPYSWLQVEMLFILIWILWKDWPAAINSVK